MVDKYIYFQMMASYDLDDGTVTIIPVLAVVVVERLCGSEGTGMGWYTEDGYFQHW
jgi:hypothetical protein